MRETSHDSSRARGAWWGVVVLMLFYVLAFVDRQVLALLVGPIRADLDLSLTEFGLLHGLSFALFYTVLGVPLGSVADTRSRRSLVGIGVVVWSAMTLLCGRAGSYTQLFLARVGVGVGEAALSPAAYSWIADAFPRDRRATAMSVYSIGIYLGSGLAFVLGGQVVAFAMERTEVEWPILGEMRSWQIPLVLAGIAGLLLAPLAWSVREPPRTGAGGASPPIAELFRWMLRHARAFFGHHGGFALLSMSGYAVNVWAVHFLESRFGLAKADASTSYGIVLGAGGAIGVLLGGVLADRARARGARDANVRIAAWASLVAGFAASGIAFVGTVGAALALLVVVSTATAAGFGVAAAGAVELIPPALRGRASAVYLFVINAAGLGFGVPMVGVLTEHVLGGEGAFPVALGIVGCVSALAAAGVLASGARAHADCVRELG